MFNNPNINVKLGLVEKTTTTNESTLLKPKNLLDILRWKDGLRYKKYQITELRQSDLMMVQCY